MTMKKLFNILTFTLLAFASDGQTSIQTKEVKIPYTNGYEIFRICISGCAVSFGDKQEYFWYTEFSKIKSTKGGSGGNLLHGNYKFYDEHGNLRQDKSYYLGLPDGSEKNWDSLGNITSQTKYNKGKIVYWKFQNDEKNWIELIGQIFQEGTIKKFILNIIRYFQKKLCYQILNSTQKPTMNILENSKKNTAQAAWVLYT
jgi:antitoxin component YwqK of YwqJK toxin-antitoxin module